MSITIAAATAGVQAAQGSKQTSSGKPTWNPNKVYKYLEDMNEGFQSYRRQAVSYYSSMISKQSGDGTMSVDELKQEIKEWFPEYTLTDKEPSKVVTGKSYLYIDEKQLKKMASDPAYRAKVYGLMDTELQGKKGYTLEYSDGRKVTSHLTGSIFSLAEKNRKYAGEDGIPYLGSCTSDTPFSSSDSHPQVRNMSYLYDNIDPAKSASKSRKAAATKEAQKKAAQEKAVQKKAAQKKAAQKKAAKKAEQARLEEKREEAQRQEELLEEIRLESRQQEETIGEGFDMTV